MLSPVVLVVKRLGPDGTFGIREFKVKWEPSQRVDATLSPLPMSMSMSMERRERT
jgi:hypothetical protein